MSHWCNNRLDSLFPPPTTTSLTGIDFLHLPLLWSASHWCLNCKNNLLLRVLGDQINLRALDFLLLERIHYGQSGPAGHLARALRGPQAFSAQWGDASSFNAQSRRNQRGISLTHCLTVIPRGFNSEMQKKKEVVQTNMFSLKHKSCVLISWSVEQIMHGHKRAH